MIEVGEKNGKELFFFKLITWAKGSLWKFYFKDNAVCYVSHPLHGPISEAEHFNWLEKAAPAIWKKDK